MLPKKTASILAVIVGFFLVLSCGGGAVTSEPENMPPLEVKPTKRPPTRPPKATSIPRPTHLPTVTQPPPAPGSMNLPPLPDFEGSVVTSGFGGGPLCDDFYQGPPHVQGAANSFVPARTGYLCLYGFGFDNGFRVELTAPDNSITLWGDYYVSSQDFDVYWNNWNLRNFGSYANWLGGSPPDGLFLIGESYTRIFIKIRWRGDLPIGDWRFRAVAESGLEVVKHFTVVAPYYPSITVVDSRQDWIIPAYSTCHFADQPQDLFALAEGYPPNRKIFLYVYEQSDGLVLQSSAQTDSLGSFYVPIRGPYRQDGKYFLIAVSEPLVGRTLPLGNMVDCFYVP
ncbi:MAG: hypothetical protein HY867_16250 [Chloroflexi bacterium]|nr:hypothetical protein [Chloroflexota bacterium]